MKIMVMILEGSTVHDDGLGCEVIANTAIRQFEMDYADANARHGLGRLCSEALAAGQCVITYAVVP